jgi:hypothetical protein
MLPRIMMLSKVHLETYAAPQWAELRAYVDEQEAHCGELMSFRAGNGILTTFCMGR